MSYFPTSKETKMHRKDTKNLLEALEASITVTVVRDPQRFAWVQAHHMMHLHYLQLFVYQINLMRTIKMGPINNANNRNT